MVTVEVLRVSNDRSRTCATAVGATIEASAPMAADGTSLL